VSVHLIDTGHMEPLPDGSEGDTGFMKGVQGLIRILNELD